MKTYCFVCKNYTDNSNLRVVKNKQRCPMCGNNKNMFTSKASVLLDSLGLNTPQNRMKNALWNAFQ